MSMARSVHIHILAVCGSLQKQSSNLDLLHTAAARAPAGVEVVILGDLLRSLPHFDPDLAEAEELPAVSAWRAAIAGSDALLVACPEYGHSLPGSLKNGVDWVIGTGELERKVVAITASVPHIERGRKGLSALRQTLDAVSARIVGGEPIAKGPDREARIDALLADLVATIEAERSDPDA